QGAPDYLAAVTAPTEVTGGEESSGGGSEEDLYDRAVAIVLRDRKASTSYVQRRLSIGYNRAADLMERMEREGVVSAASNVGRREILASPAGDSGESSSGSRSAA
ncbi:MAG: DNA translocase FtsK, partial [Sphingomonadaceae bacterium]